MPNAGMRKNRIEKVRVALCAILVFITIGLDFKHVWDVLQIPPEARQALAMTFTNEVTIVGVIMMGLLASALFLFRATFKAGVLLQALSVLIVAGLQLKSGNTRGALLEIPFICATLVMFYLGYPFDANQTRTAE